jgi:membrane associated rhomboid family serine protease
VRQEQARESPKWTFVFIAVCVVAFLFQQVTDLWVYLAFIPAVALDYPWMFLTSIFLHASFSHLFFNMLALFFFGIYLEPMIGRRRFFALFFAAGIVGNVVYMLTAVDPLAPAIGASGAIYGIVGTLAVLAPLAIVFVGFVPLPMILVAIGYAFLAYVGLFNPSSSIAEGAHLGGIFLGAAYGVYLRLRFRRR